MTISNSETQIPRQIFIKVYFKMFPLLRGKKKSVHSFFFFAGLRWNGLVEHSTMTTAERRAGGWIN